MMEVEEDLSDEEVFTAAAAENNGLLHKPLMAPRVLPRTRVRKVPSLRIVWAPVLYFLLTLAAVISLISLVVFLIEVLTSKQRGVHRPPPSPCSRISSKDVWVKTFPMLTTESAVRIADLNADAVPDAIIAFGTGADAFYYPEVVCRVYFGGGSAGECGGGVLALDGRSGRELWRHYAAHELFALNCNADMNGDAVPDCLAAGRMAGLVCLSGVDGRLLWEFDDQSGARIDASNVYTPLLIPDADGDRVPDIVTLHGGDPLKEPGSVSRLVGRVLVLSGRTGRVLRWVQVPDQRESYYSPQILTHPDGSSFLLFGTGGETHGGSLWVVKMKDLLTGEINRAERLYRDRWKGVMTPPVLVDVTGDGVRDIVMAMFNSTVIAFDGLSFARLWEYALPAPSESYSTPGVGYFNNDSVPDFIINYQTGPGFPLYDYTQTTVLDGRNGRPLLSHPMRHLVATQSSPLSVSLSPHGNDLFLYWTADCHNAPTAHHPLQFIKGTSVHEQSRADFCKLRFKEKLFTRMYALSRHLSHQPSIIYDSDVRRGTEYSNPINYTALGLEFLVRHPGYREDFLRPEDPPYEDYPQYYMQHYYTPEYRRQPARKQLYRGSLAPPVASGGSGVDVVFATYWFYPSEAQALSPDDQDCIRTQMSAEKQRFDPTNNYYGLDHDAYEEAVTEDCLKASGHFGAKRGGYNPFDRPMGQMTVYRTHLECECSGGPPCARILPYQQQMWPAYMGARGDSVANILSAPPSL